MLTKRGHDVRTAGNLATALRGPGSVEVELLISDIELPDGSGLELMRRLSSRSTMPGIALSGFGSSDDIDQSRSAGFAEHLTKPVDFRRLEEAIVTGQSWSSTVVSPRAAGCSETVNFELINESSSDHSHRLSCPVRSRSGVPCAVLQTTGVRGWPQSISHQVARRGMLDQAIGPSRPWAW